MLRPVAYSHGQQIDICERFGVVTVSTSPIVAPFSAKTSPFPRQTPRLVSVDVLRGIVMVIMALDHTRDFMSYTRPVPEDLAHTSGALFFTRFITHYCAPVFAFLTGTGAFLSTRRGKSLKQLSWFFMTRGLWLVILELTIVDYAWGFVPWAHAGVIWVLGWSMVAMSAVVWLPARWIAVLGLGIVASHNLLDRISPDSFGNLGWMWILLHSPGRIAVTDHFSLSVRYVLIPWIGVMATGFAFGRLLLKPDRRKWILIIGTSATILFFVLRGINAYGNGIAAFPARYSYSAGAWSVQPTIALSIMSFFNTLKYPPSLDYLLMTLGPALIALALLDGIQGASGLSRILLVFGRVPLFYYILHLYLIHTLAILAAVAFHQPIWHGTVIADFAQRPAGYGHGLLFIYAMWILAVTILYFPSRWFMELKSRHRDWASLSYL